FVLFTFHIILILYSVLSTLLVLSSLSFSFLFPYTTLFRSLTPSLTGIERNPDDRRIPPHTARTAAATVFYLADSGVVPDPGTGSDRKSTRLNSSHVSISYAVFCLKK